MDNPRGKEAANRWIAKLTEEKLFGNFITIGCEECSHECRGTDAQIYPMFSSATSEIDDVLKELLKVYRKFHVDVSFRMGSAAKIIIGVVVGVAVVAAVVIPCVLLIPSSSSVSDKPTFAFEDIWSSKYNYKSIYPAWDTSTTSDSDFLTTNDNRTLVRRNIKQPYTDVDTVASYMLYEKYGVYNAYSVSPDVKFIYYRYNYTKVWRHSYTADFVIWDVDNKKEVNANLPSNIHHMEWSPIGHKLAFVHDFTVKLIEDVANPAIKTVSDPGEKNKDYYGIPDWMYEEEMISSNNVLYWNPSGTRLAYLHTNEDGVNLIKYTWYGDGQYPETIEIAYPKAGTTISNVDLWVYHLDSGNITELIAPSEFQSEDFYFSRFTWKDDDVCLGTWTNRFQTTSIANLYEKNADDEKFTVTTSNAMKEVVNGGWVGSFGPFYPIWKTDGDQNDYFTIYARTKTGDTSDGYWQIAYVEEGNQNKRWLTNTDYDIVELNFYDGTNQYLYFTAAYDLPRRRQILRVKASDSDITNPDCMTCIYNQTYENRCGWITPSFNKEGSFVVINCRGNWIPMTLLVPISTDGTWKDATLLENNDDLTTKVEQVQWPRREYRTYKSVNYPEKEYNYEIWFPEDFNQNEKYPLLIEVYAGPEFQKVTDTWRKGFSQTYMVSGRKMIVASVDGRGSAYEGYKFMRQTYMKLGQFEPQDQTDFAKHLISTYPSYIDSDNVAIWGWSYGGYTTSHTLGFDASETFKCGIAVAPLGDWRWYDAMYAERYMGNVTTNDDGYTKASIITGHKMENFKGTNYVLIHGTADDNVHFQSAAEMEKALVAADVDFDDFFYADEAHSINGGPNANQHIYHQLDIRLSYCLGRVNSPYGV